MDKYLHDPNHHFDKTFRNQIHQMQHGLNMNHAYPEPVTNPHRFFCTFLDTARWTVSALPGMRNAFLRSVIDNH